MDKNSPLAKRFEDNFEVSFATHRPHVKKTVAKRQKKANFDSAFFYFFIPALIGLALIMLA